MCACVYVASLQSPNRSSEEEVALSLLGPKRREDEGLTQRFGDIREQHESLEGVHTLCSRRHTQLRERLMLIYFQGQVSGHVAEELGNGCRRGEESQTGETENTEVSGERLLRWQEFEANSHS